MLIDKYIICFDSAIRWASKQTGLPVPPPRALSALFCIKRGAGYPQVVKAYLKRYDDTKGIYNAIKWLQASGFIHGTPFVLTIEAREFIGIVNMYLKNLRLERPIYEKHNNSSARR